MKKFNFIILSLLLMFFSLSSNIYADIWSANFNKDLDMSTLNYVVNNTFTKGEMLNATNLVYYQDFNTPENRWFTLGDNGVVTTSIQSSINKNINPYLSLFFQTGTEYCFARNNCIWEFAHWFNKSMIFNANTRIYFNCQIVTPNRYYFLKFYDELGNIIFQVSNGGCNLNRVSPIHCYDWDKDGDNFGFNHCEVDGHFSLYLNQISNITQDIDLPNTRFQTISFGSVTGILGTTLSIENISISDFTSAINSLPIIEDINFLNAPCFNSTSQNAYLDWEADITDLENDTVYYSLNKFFYNKYKLVFYEDFIKIENGKCKGDYSSIGTSFISNVTGFRNTEKFISDLNTDLMFMTNTFYDLGISKISYYTDGILTGCTGYLMLPDCYISKVNYISPVPLEYNNTLSFYLNMRANLNTITITPRQDTGQSIFDLKFTQGTNNLTVTYNFVTVFNYIHNYTSDMYKDLENEILVTFDFNSITDLVNINFVYLLNGIPVSYSLTQNISHNNIKAVTLFFNHNEATCEKTRFMGLRNFKLENSGFIAVPSFSSTFPTPLLFSETGNYIMTLYVSDVIHQPLSYTEKEVYLTIGKCEDTIQPSKVYSRDSNTALESISVGMYIICSIFDNSNNIGIRGFSFCDLIFYGYLFFAIILAIIMFLIFNNINFSLLFFSIIMIVGGIKFDNYSFIRYTPLWKLIIGLIFTVSLVTSLVSIILNNNNNQGVNNE